MISARFTHYTLLIFLLPCFLLWKLVTKSSSQSKRRRFISFSLKEHLIVFFDIPLYLCISSPFILTYSFIHAFIHLTIYYCSIMPSSLLLRPPAVLPSSRLEIFKYALCTVVRVITTSQRYNFDILLLLLFHSSHPFPTKTSLSQLDTKVWHKRSLIA